MEVLAVICTISLGVLVISGIICLFSLLGCISENQIGDLCEKVLEVCIIIAMISGVLTTITAIILFDTNISRR